MDPIECYNNKYQYFITKTLKFLVPISLLSLFLSYATGFSFIFSLNFSLFNFTFPPFLHALERKYMFLICNGILAFLAKGLNFSSTPSPCLDIDLRKCIEDSVKPLSEEQENGDLEETLYHGEDFPSDIPEKELSLSLPETTDSVCVTDRDKTVRSGYAKVSLYREKDLPSDILEKELSLSLPDTIDSVCVTDRDRTVTSGYAMVSLYRGKDLPSDILEKELSLSLPETTNSVCVTDRDKTVTSGYAMVSLYRRKDLPSDLLENELSLSLPDTTDSVCVTDRDKTVTSGYTRDKDNGFSDITDGRLFPREKGFMEERKSEVLLESEDSEGEDDEEVEESGSLIGSSSAGEAANEVNIDTEELNKKFEEFIRKMKEEIRIEAQQQLIKV